MERERALLLHKPNPNFHITNIFLLKIISRNDLFSLARKCIVGGVHQVGRIYKSVRGACGRQTTSPHTSTGKTRLYTQHFAENGLSGKICV